MPPAEKRASDAFAAVAADLLREPGVEEGTGFGKQPGLRVRGKIFAMLVREELVVKLPAERSATVIEAGGAHRFKIGQRQMREWVSVDHAGLHDWTELAREALSFVRGRNIG